MAKSKDKIPIVDEVWRKRAAMIEALRRHKCIVWKACQEVGITRYQHDDWMRDDPDYKATYQTIKEDQIDFVESKLLELVEGAEYEVMTEHGPQVMKDAPNAQAVKFYLETQAKKRGFVVRQEITGAEGGPIQIIAPDEI